MAAPVQCDMCDGTGDVDDGTRDLKRCGACDGTGRAVRCACGLESIPVALEVTHLTDFDSEEEVHTPDRCARYTPRDGWEHYRAAFARRGWQSTRDGMPLWCVPFADSYRAPREGDAS